MLRGVALFSALTISGCSLILGKPATLGWPSGDPDDYAYQQSYNCYVYDKTMPVDMEIAITGTAIAIAGWILREDGREIGQPIAIGAGVVTAPFLFSGIAGGLGRSRCHRWAREIPLMPYGGSPPPVPMGNEGSGAPGESDGPPLDSGAGARGQIDQVKTSGTGTSVAWPQAPAADTAATLGARRGGARNQTLTLDFGAGKTCDVGDATWRKYSDGQNVNLEVRIRSGEIVCSSM